MTPKRAAREWGSIVRKLQAVKDRIEQLCRLASDTEDATKDAITDFEPDWGWADNLDELINEGEEWRQKLEQEADNEQAD